MQPAVQVLLDADTGSNIFESRDLLIKSLAYKTSPQKQGQNTKVPLC